MRSLALLSAVFLLSLVSQWHEASAQPNPDCLSMTGTNLFCLASQTCLEVANSSAYDLICNNMSNCGVIGQDEGGFFNNRLRCSNVSGGMSFYECPTNAEFINITSLCDGIEDCSGGAGEDERNILCADKCRRPYYGGCSLSRVCINDPNDRLCRGCVSGFYEVSTATFDCTAIPAIVEWDTSTYTVSETSASLEVCLNVSLDLSVGSGLADSLGDRVVTVQVSFVDRTAMVGVDYTFQTQNITLNDTVRRQCITIGISGSVGIVTEDLYFNLTLSNADPSGLGTSGVLPFDTEVVIVDEDLLVLDPLSTSISVNESVGSVEVCYVARQEVRAPGNISLTLNVTSVPASPTTFIGQPDVLTYELSNAMNGTQVCFNLSVTDDLVVESMESYSMVLSSDSSFVMSPITRVTLSVEDNDAYTLTLQAANGTTTTVQEGNNATVEVLLQGAVAPGIPVQAQLTVLPETASEMSDYNLVSMPMITFMSDPMISEQVKSYTIDVLSDNLLEGYETFSVSLVSTSQTVNYTIEDIDVGTVSFTQATFTSTTNIGPMVNENSVYLTATLDIGSQVELQYTLSWINGTDIYFTFSPSAMNSSVSETVYLFSDGYVDGVLNVTRPLTMLPSNATGLSVTDVAMVNIMMYDPDVVIIAFDQEVYMFDESDGYTTVSFTFDGSIGGPFQNYSTSVDVMSFLASLASYTADVGTDVSGPPEVFVFNTTSPSMGGGNYSFTINDDSLVEYDEVFFVELTTVDMFLYLTETQLNVTIAMDDRLYVAFEQTNTTVTETNMTLSVCLDVNTSLIAVSIDLMFNVDFITATGGLDVILISSPRITVEPESNDTYCLFFTILEDSLLEVSESLSIAVTAQGTSSGITTISMLGGAHTVVINDDVSDAVITIEVSNSLPEEPPVFNELDGTGVLSFYLNTSSNTLATNVSVDVTIMNGTAYQGVDFNLQDFTVTFTPSTLTQNMTFGIIDDSITELTESFTLSFTADDPIVTITPPTVGIDLESNDALEITIERPILLASEGSLFTIPVVITGFYDSVNAFIDSWSFEVSPFDNAINGTDYVIYRDSQVDVISASVSQVNLTGEVFTDTFIEGVESFGVNLTVVDSALVKLGDMYRASVFIIEYIVPVMLNFNDTMDFTFSESDGMVTIPVSLELMNASLDTELSFSVTATNDTALEGVDFDLLDSSVMFTPSSLSQNISLYLTADSMAGDSEMFSIGLSADDAFIRIAGPSNVSVVITNDDDPCDADPCDDNANCTSTGGSNFTCTCLPGYSGNGLTCYDINECMNGTDNCDDNAECTNVNGSFTCTCDMGYTGDGLNCTDIDECAMYSDDCDDNADCENTDGGFNCTCDDGYYGNGVNCTDIDECELDSDNCDDNADCVNTDGGFNCTCDEGYYGNGINCTDVDECEMDSDNCDDNADCENTDGGFNCTCDDGYYGNGVNCTDIDNCAMDVCDDNALCENTDGGFNCTCDDGYYGNGFNCTDIDECEMYSDDCDDNADCENTNGGFNCTCDDGYYGNGVNCTDIDECEMYSDDCDDNADCENTNGGFNCTCDDGYYGNGVNCTDIDECEMYSDDCDDNADCENTDGGFNCTCDDGYYGNGVNCTDIDECEMYSDDCDDNADCENTNGGFNCTCDDGYYGNGVNCTDVDECVLSTDNCDSYAECTNTDGSFNCTCNTGYTGDGLNCTDVNECTSGTDNCDDNAECTNTDGSFTCTCDMGYTGDGVTCTGMMFGDDPHFSVVLPSNKMLCFSVMGDHHLSYNLVSNNKLLMNAVFLPDSRREEVTWIGSLGIVVKNSTKSAQNKLKFTAKPPSISFNSKAILNPKNIDKIVFKNGRVTISEAPPFSGFRYSSVLIRLEDAGLSFTIKFMNEHLDMFWHSTSQQHEDSHGLIGQFFRQGVEIDEIRKILIMPNKEPVPVMRRPVWAFMEREQKDDQLCWTAMNPGYQGQGLIDGKYSNYAVKDVLADKFVFGEL